MLTPRQPGETDQQYAARCAMEAQQGMQSPLAAQPAQAAPNALQQLGMPQPGFMQQPGALAGGMNAGGASPYGQQQPLVDPVQRDAMLSTYGNRMELDELDRQLSEANALRDTPLPEGRQAGRTFVAANPLEFIGAGIKQFKGNRDIKRINEGERNPGYGPGVLKEPGSQPEFKKEGRNSLRKKIGKAVASFGRNLDDED